MAELKTQKNDADVVDFIHSTVEDEVKRQDCLALLKIFEDCIGEPAAMWGGSIIGFGSYHYKSQRSSQEGDWLLSGFSPRKQNITIYISCGFDTYHNELARLGKHTTSKSCLHVKRLADIDLDVLRFLITDGAKRTQAMFAS